MKDRNAPFIVEKFLGNIFLSLHSIYCEIVCTVEATTSAIVFARAFAESDICTTTMPPLSSLIAFPDIGTAGSVL